MGKTGLVLEGGAMRGIFTAGALDYLLEKDINFDYVVGVSAGSGNAVNFVSRQFGRTKQIITHENAESYYGMKQLIKHGRILNLHTLVTDYALNQIPYDFDTFFSSKTECESVVVNCETASVEYKGGYKDKDEFFKYNIASCSLPFICSPMEINGHHYLDGSIIDSIPVKRAVEKGCDKILVILTKPEGERPTDYSKARRAVKKYYSKYPLLADVMANRRDAYEEQDEYMHELEAEGKVFILRPDVQKIKHFEPSTEKLLNCYDYGYHMMEEYYDAFLDFMADDEEE